MSEVGYGMHGLVNGRVGEGGGNDVCGFLGFCMSEDFGDGRRSCKKGLFLFFFSTWAGKGC